jgi:hypothetical protein
MLGFGADACVVAPSEAVQCARDVAAEIALLYG